MRCAYDRPTRRACLVVFAMTLVVSCGGGQDASVGEGQVLQPSGAADGLVVSFATQPEPLEKGENTIQVTVTRADGSPVTDAAVAAVFSMPAMPSMNMPAMRSDATLRHEGEGRYRGTGQLSMGGTWNVAVTVAQGSKELATRRLSIVARE